MYLIYKIKNNITGKVYIGATNKCPVERLKEHIRSKSNVGKDIRILGLNKFEFKIVSKINSNPEKAAEMENYHIDKYRKNSYNGLPSSNVIADSVLNNLEYTGFSLKKINEIVKLKLIYKRKTIPKGVVIPLRTETLKSVKIKRINKRLSKKKREYKILKKENEILKKEASNLHSKLNRFKNRSKDNTVSVTCVQQTRNKVNISYQKESEELKNVYKNTIMCPVVSRVNTENIKRLNISIAENRVLKHKMKKLNTQLNKQNCTPNLSIIENTKSDQKQPHLSII